MRFWSKLFKSVRRNEEGDDTITPHVNTNNNNNTTSSSSSAGGSSKRLTSPTTTSAGNSSSSKNKFLDVDDDTKSVDSTNSNQGNHTDYSKLNLEDVFDFEGIEIMCREAEDLNLIE